MAQPSRLQRVMDRYHRQITQHTEQVQAQVVVRYQATRAELERRILALQAQMVASVQVGEPVNPLWLYDQRRMHILLEGMRTHVDMFARQAREQVAAAQEYAARIGSDSAHAALDSTVPAGVEYTFGTPSADALDQLASALQPGSPVSALFDGWGNAASQAAQQALFTGVAIGDNPRDIGSSVSATLDMPLQRAQTIARTETLRAYRAAQHATYRANADVVSQWKWSADKSGRTCGACLAMDGTLHDLDETLGDHVCGRCAAVPVTKSWADILGPLGIDTRDIPDTGEEEESGSDWFGRQSAATQTQILGPAKQAAYAQGDITLQDLVGYTHSPTWGTSIQEKSLKSLGLDARQYHKGA